MRHSRLRENDELFRASLCIIGIWVAAQARNDRMLNDSEAHHPKRC